MLPLLSVACLYEYKNLGLKNMSSKWSADCQQVGFNLNPNYL